MSTKAADRPTRRRQAFVCGPADKGERFQAAELEGAGVVANRFLRSGNRGFPAGPQLLDLIAGQGTAKIRERPPRVKEHRRRFVHVVQQKNTLVQSGDHAAELGAVEVRIGGGHQPVQQTVAIALGLQAADHPGPGVGQRFIVEIDRILGCQHHPKAESARLFEQSQQRRFGRRIADRRQIAKDLGEVEHGAQTAGARLTADPADDLGEQQRDEKHALAVRQMSDGKYRYARLAGFTVEQTVDVQRFTLQPGAESRCSQEIVERHGQLKTLLAGIERFHFKDADPLERRRLHRLDQCRQIEGLAGRPIVFEQ